MPRWTIAPRMKPGRPGGASVPTAAVASCNGHVYVFGGDDGLGQDDLVQDLDTATGEVQRGQIAPADRVHLAAWLAQRFGGG